MHRINKDVIAAVIGFVFTVVGVTSSCYFLFRCISFRSSGAYSQAGMWQLADMERILLLSSAVTVVSFITLVVALMDVSVCVNDADMVSGVFGLVSDTPSAVDNKDSVDTVLLWRLMQMSDTVEDADKQLECCTGIRTDGDKLRYLCDTYGCHVPGWEKGDIHGCYVSLLESIVVSSGWRHCDRYYGNVRECGIDMHDDDLPALQVMS